jgi:hypothetical protein
MMASLIDTENTLKGVDCAEELLCSQVGYQLLHKGCGVKYPIFVKLISFAKVWWFFELVEPKEGESVDDLSQGMRVDDAFRLLSLFAKVHLVLHLRCCMEQNMSIADLLIFIQYIFKMFATG